MWLRLLGTLEDVVRLHDRFRKTFGLAITASQFEDLVRLQEPETIAMSEIFAVLDTNRDGRIDGLEFLAAVACVCRATFEDKARCTLCLLFGFRVIVMKDSAVCTLLVVFDLFDFNMNGSLSVTEMVCVSIETRLIPLANLFT